MAAVSLFWNTNINAVTSCENAHVEGTRAVPGKVRLAVIIGSGQERNSDGSEKSASFVQVHKNLYLRENIF